MYRERRRLELLIRKINEARAKNRCWTTSVYLDVALAQIIYAYEEVLKFKRNRGATYLPDD